MSSPHVPTPWLLLWMFGCLPVKNDSGSMPVQDSASTDTADTGTVIDCTDPFEAFYDADGDGYGDDDLVIETCTLEPGYTSQGGDCDDIDPERNPDALEQCNEIDDDCDGDVDEDAAGSLWFADADGDGWGDESDAVESCTVLDDRVTQAGDCNDERSNIHPDAEETCNGFDDNCDGTVDEDTTPGAPTWYADADRDGHGDPGSMVVSCWAPDGYVADGTDCNDESGTIFPGAAEVCNGLDDDCDDAVDEDLEMSDWYEDLDDDGWGVLREGGAISSCAEVPDRVTTTGDCNDDDPTVHPGATERCNEIDDDCDTEIDEGLESADWYEDIDDDGWGGEGVPISSCDVVVDRVTTTGDCDDDDSTVHPGATELCNEIDDDCDGETDEDLTMSIWFPDGDGDGWGTGDDTLMACVAGEGWTLESGDCDDTDPTVHPGALEECNGIDDNCNDGVDEGFDVVVLYLDADGDGYGDPGFSMDGCVGIEGYSRDPTDCDDDDPDVNPGAEEIMDDGIDNDCDGKTDFL